MKRLSLLILICFSFNVFADNGTTIAFVQGQTGSAGNPVFANPVKKGSLLIVAVFCTAAGTCRGSSGNYTLIKFQVNTGDGSGLALYYNVAKKEGPESVVATGGSIFANLCAEYTGIQNAVLISTVPSSESPGATAVTSGNGIVKEHGPIILLGAMSNSNAGGTITANSGFNLRVKSTNVGDQLALSDLIINSTAPVMNAGFTQSTSQTFACIMAGFRPGNRRRVMNGM